MILVVVKIKASFTKYIHASLKAMLKLLIKFIFSCGILVTAAKSRQEIKAVSIAISDVVRELFLKQKISFEFIVYEAVFTISNEIIFTVNRENFGEFKTEVRTNKSDTPKIIKSSILLNPSEEILHQTFNSIDFKRTTGMRFPQS